MPEIKRIFLETYRRRNFMMKNELLRARLFTSTTENNGIIQKVNFEIRGERGEV